MASPQPGADRPEPPIALVQHRRLEGDGDVGVGEARPAVAHLDDVDRPASRRTSTSTGRPDGVTRRAFSRRPSTSWRTRAGSVTVQAWATVRDEGEGHPDGGAPPRPDGLDLPSEGDEVGVLRGHAGPVRAEPGQVEQVADEPLEPLGLGEDDTSHPSRLLGRHDTAREGLGVAADAGQGRAEVVRHRQEEVALAPLRSRERSRRGSSGRSRPRPPRRGPRRGRARRGAPPRGRAPPRPCGAAGGPRVAPR